MRETEITHPIEIKRLELAERILSKLGIDHWIRENTDDPDKRIEKNNEYLERVIEKVEEYSKDIKRLELAERILSKLGIDHWIRENIDDPDKRIEKNNEYLKKVIENQQTTIKLKLRYDR